MKALLIGLLAITACFSARAEDSVYCVEGETSLDVRQTDDNTLHVSAKSSMLFLIKVEVKYQLSSQFIQIEADKTPLSNTRISEVRLTYDNGTSVRKVFLLSWHKFSDGGEVPVYIYFQYPGSTELEFIERLDCQASQS